MISPAPRLPGYLARLTVSSPMPPRRRRYRRTAGLSVERAFETLVSAAGPRERWVGHTRNSESAIPAGRARTGHCPLVPAGYRTERKERRWTGPRPSALAHKGKTMKRIIGILA